MTINRIPPGAPLDMPRDYDAASIAPGVVDVNAMTIVYTAFATVNRTQLKMQQNAMQNQLKETMSAAAKMRSGANERFQAALSNGIAGIVGGCLSGAGAAHALSATKISAKPPTPVSTLTPNSVKVNTISAEKMNPAMSVKVAPTTPAARKAAPGKEEKAVSADQDSHASRKPGTDPKAKEPPSGEDSYAESTMKSTCINARMQIWEAIGKAVTGAGQIGAGYKERQGANKEADAKEHDGNAQLYGADGSRLAGQNEATAGFEKSVVDAIAQHSQNVTQTNKGMFQK